MGEPQFKVTWTDREAGDTDWTVGQLDAFAVVRLVIEYRMEPGSKVIIERID